MIKSKLTYSKLTEVLFDSMLKKIALKSGLITFVKNKKRFEGWLKVEVIDSLDSTFPKSHIVPEKDRIDVVCDNFGIELKVLCTEYDWESNPEIPKRNNNKNIKRVIKDIEKFKNLKTSNLKKIIFFIAFPIPKINSNDWTTLLSKSLADKPVKNLKIQDIVFKNNVLGKMYICEVD